MSSVRSAILAALCLALAPHLAPAQAGTRTRVNLRPDSTTRLPAIRVLASQEELELLAPDTSDTGFLAVRTTRGEEGWVHADYVWLADPDTGVEAFVAPVIRNLDEPLDDISPNLEKPPVRGSRINYRGNATASHESCGPEGAGRAGATTRIDSATFRLKNRTDAPAFSYAVTWDALARLPYARSNVPDDRFEWLDSVLTEIERYEGVPLTLTGFIAAITDQKKGSGNETGETTNCRWTENLHVDWHVSMTRRHTDGVDRAFVVEPTPRFLRRHPTTWTIPRLRDWMGTARQSGDSVRVTGYLFFDPDHYKHIVPSPGQRRYRISMWELHPVSKIEVRRNGEWIDLDDLP